jgi:hypothetical protein
LLGYKYSLLTIVFNLKPFTVSYRHHTIFLIHLGFPLVIFPMADVDAINQSDVATVKKCGCGRPCGSKNKPKSSLAMIASSSTPAKRHPGRLLGSKNKKYAIAIADPTDRLDVSFAHPFVPSSSSSDLFSIFSFCAN